MHRVDVCSCGGKRVLIPWRRWRASLGLAFGGVSLAAAPGGAGVLDAAWIAPTTNTDGSQLTDLESYRLYYEASSPPCPGPSFFLVASPTSSPPPDQTVAFRLTGLVTGTLYTVSVTAVNTSGNESACSITASAVARISFAVSPTGSVNFGNVNVGSFADQVLTVSNTGGGTVSGTVSTSAPFSIVSGSPFTLVGLGTTQALTVRFTPITSATATVNLNASADGDTLSRILTGTGIVLDTIPPTIAITVPTPDPTYSTSDPILTLEGTVSDDIGVTLVTWENSRGGTGAATGTTTWAARGIVLRLGTNVLTVRARDAAGNIAAAILTVTLAPFTFSDDPLAAQSTLVRAAHVVELRAAIDRVRLARGLPTFDWTDPTLTPGSTPAKAVHLLELRTALNQAYEAAGQTPLTYSDPTIVAELAVIKAVHLNELRAGVRALE